MQISFDTATMDQHEARGLIVLLNTVSPGALQAAMNAIGNPPSVTITGDARTRPEHYTRPAPVTDLYATGEPVDDPTRDPAVAFGPLGGAAPAAPIAPAAPPVTPPPPAAGAGPIDSRGFPYDDRIHSKSREGTGTLNADGSWRGKRNTPEALVAQVEAEWVAKGYGPGPTPPETVGGEPLPSAGVPAPPVAPPAPPAPTSDSAPPAATVSPEPVASSPAPSLTPIQQFQALMGKVTPAQVAGRIAKPDVDAMCTSAGINNLADLMKRPDLIPLIEAQVDALLNPAGV